MTTKKPNYKPLRVSFDSGKVVQIGRCALSNLDTLLECQDGLLRKYIEADGALAVLMTDNEFISKLELACSVLPIVGSEDKCLDFEDIKENWEQIVTLFFNSSFDKNTRQMNTISQSEVSSLHFLPFAAQLEKHLEQRRKLREAEKKDYLS